MTIDAHDVETLVRDNRRFVFFMMKRVSRRGADADDMESAGWLALLRAARTWKPERGQFSTWACVCIRNALMQVATAAQCQKRQRSIRFSDLREWTTRGFRAAPDTELSAVLAREEVPLLLTGLPPRLACVVRLIYFEGLTIRQAARLLGVSTSRVGQMKLKALRVMREAAGE